MTSAPPEAAKDPRRPALTYRVLLVTSLVFVIVVAIANSPGVHDGVLVALVAAGWLPLFAVHHWPRTTYMIVLAVECLHTAMVPLGDPVQFSSIPVTTMIVVYTIAVRMPGRAAWTYGGLAAVLVLVLGTFTRDGQPFAASMFALDLVLGATGAGVLVRNRQERLASMEQRAVVAERTKDEEARRRVAAERLRMARDLHDVVAHHLTLVNAQSSVAQYLVRNDPGAAEKALRNLTEHTRAALDELRSTVGLLRQVTDDELTDHPEHQPTDSSLAPTPGLADLAALVSRHRTMPGRVVLHVDGDPAPLPALIDLAAYRIAQESLTNARKYAPGADVLVELIWQDATLHLRIENAPPRHTVPAEPGSGHGILGMRERASALGGALAAGPRTNGGWSVVAALPIGTRADAPDQESP